MESSNKKVLFGKIYTTSLYSQNTPRFMTLERMKTFTIKYIRSIRLIRKIRVPLPFQQPKSIQNKYITFYNFRKNENIYNKINSLHSPNS